MPRQGLTKEVITAEAIKQIEEIGCEHFSMREFAAKLNVKAASLYNHIENIDEIRTGVGLNAIEMMNNTLAAAVADKAGDEAIVAASKAYRLFAGEHPEIYKMIFKVPESCDSVLINEWPNSLRPLINIVDTYRLTQEDKINFLRYWRSAVHGFISLEQAKYLKDPRVSTEKSFENMIAVLIEALHAMEEK